MQENKNYKTKEIMNRMFSYIRKYKLSVLAYLVLSACVTLINLACAELINDSVGSSIDGRQNDLVRCLLLAGLVLFAGIFITFFSTYIYGRFKSRVILDIRNNAVERLQKLKLSFIENSHTGDLISRFTRDMNSLLNFIGEDLFKTAIMLVSIVITSVYLISVSWKLYIVSLVLMPPVLYFSTKITKPMIGFYKESSAEIGKATAFAQDSYGGIFIIKAFNLESLFFDKFSGMVKKSYDYDIKGIHRMKWMPPFNIILWSAPFTICMIYGAFLSINKEIEPGRIFAFVYLLNNIVWPISGLPRTVTNFRNSLGTARRFFDVIDSPAEREDGSAFSPDGAEYCIELKDLTFSYGTEQPAAAAAAASSGGQEESLEAVVNTNAVNGDEGSLADIKRVLDRLSFGIKPGSRTALVGASGCGKSTVLKLISGFYDYREGNIELYGHELREWSIAAIRSNISLVSQDTYLFPASVYDNILYGRPDATREEVMNAAISACAHEFIMELPEGYDTLVGERGIKLSGGQKQRISLARAFLKDAPVILLDEPTSALDTISESLVQEAMNSVMRDKTAIIVTHRLSTIKDVDEILVMDRGQIVERGTHEALATCDSLYSKLYSRQTAKSEDTGVGEAEGKWMAASEDDSAVGEEGEAAV